MSKILTGRKYSDETRRKMSEAHKGKKLSDEHKQKISEWTKSKWEDGTFGSEKHLSKLRGRPAWNKGVPHSEEAKENMSHSQKKRYDDSEEHERQSERMKKRFSDPDERKRQSERMKKMHEERPEIREKISKTMKGREVTEEHRKNLSASLTAHPALSGENSRFWKGGTGDLKYPPEFTVQLKRMIRKRDNHICQACNNRVKGKSAHVHHIDGDKMNCDEWNLTLICITCHGAIHERNNIMNEGIEYFKTRLSAMKEYHQNKNL